MELTIRGTAERLGISADMIRRRLKAGELDGRQEPQGKQGYRWIVQLPEDAQDTPTAEAYELADACVRIVGKRLRGVKVKRSASYGSCSVGEVLRIC